MKRKIALVGYYNYTVIATYIGMLSGFAGIVCVMNGMLSLAVIYLMVAGICDMFDGAIAATKQRDDREKRFGIQLDSLNDLICFGVLPVILVYAVCEKDILSLLCGGLYLLCALIRLAYFNVCEEDRQQTEQGRRKYYEGLPVTSVALILPAVFILVDVWHLPTILFVITMAVTAVAFILPFSLRKPRMAGKCGFMLMGIAEMTVLLTNMGRQK